MKVPLAIPAHGTLRGLADAVMRIVSAIVEGWNVQHNSDGTHKFPAEAISFNAGAFTGSVSMTWTVAANNVTTWRKAYIGPWLVMTLEVSGTTVGGTISNNLRVALPDDKRVRGRQAGAFKYLDAGTDGTGVWIAVDGSRFVQLFRDYNLTNWTAGTAAVIGQFVIEVE